MTPPPAPQAAHGACPHCGLAVEGPEDRYCCPGCELAAQIISGAGLERYYEERTALPDRPEQLQADWSGVPVEIRPDGTSEARLCVDGLRCASCVWVVERVLEQTEGVQQAHVSYASGRAMVTFDPARTSLSDVGARIAALGYRPRPVDAAPTGDRDLLTRLGVAAFCAANIMLLSASVYAGWLDGMAERYAALFRWGQLILATPVALWSAAPFFDGAWTGLKHRVLHMDLPISVAVAVLYVHGVAMTLLHGDGYLDSLGMLVTLLLAGRVLEARGRRSAAAAAATLAAELPSTARRTTDDGVQTVSVDALRVGDRVEVGVGETLPADGVVRRGSASVRMALVTGESEPVTVGVGDRVVAGAPLLDGAVTVEVDRVGEQTLGRKMAAAVRASVDRGLPETPADRIAPWFTGATLLAALTAFVAWSVTTDVGTGLQVMVAVLVVACPCALGLSWPTAVSAGLASLARRGLVLGSGDALLRLAEVDVVALDKTGTVTGGAPVVVSADDAVLRIAAGLERASAHPVAKAIRDEAARRGLPLPLADDLHETAGVGVSGVVDGERWTLSAGGPGEVRLQGEGGLVGLIRLRDVRRDDAPAAVAALRSEGQRVALLTGDHDEVATRLGDEVGVSEVEARMTPDDKAAWIRARQSEGHTVLLVGDGLNDGPALVAADVGLAMKAGAPSSVLAADGVIAQEALGPVVAALRGARVVRDVVRANLVRSLVYNVVAVSLALAGLINPLVAAVLMPLSSAMVWVGGFGVERRLAREEAKWTSS